MHSIEVLENYPFSVIFHCSHTQPLSVIERLHFPVSPCMTFYAHSCMPTVPISEGQSHFFEGCPSKDLRISTDVPPTDVGYNDHNYMEMY